MRLARAMSWSVETTVHSTPPYKLLLLLLPGSLLCVAMLDAEYRDVIASRLGHVFPRTFSPDHLPRYDLPCLVLPSTILKSWRFGCIADYLLYCEPSSVAFTASQRSAVSTTSSSRRPVQLYVVFLSRVHDVVLVSSCQVVRHLSRARIPRMVTVNTC